MNRGERYIKNCTKHVFKYVFNERYYDEMLKNSRFTLRSKESYESVEEKYVKLFNVGDKIIRVKFIKNDKKTFGYEVTQVVIYSKDNIVKKSLPINKEERKVYINADYKNYLLFHSNSFYMLKATKVNKDVKKFLHHLGVALKSMSEPPKSSKKSTKTLQDIQKWATGNIEKSFKRQYRIEYLLKNNTEK